MLQIVMCMFSFRAASFIKSELRWVELSWNVSGQLHTFTFILSIIICFMPGGTCFVFIDGQA